MVHSHDVEIDTLIPGPSISPVGPSAPLTFLWLYPALATLHALSFMHLGPLGILRKSNRVVCVLPRQLTTLSMADSGSPVLEPASASPSLFRMDGIRPRV